MMAQQTVLIVDDDPHIREVLRYALEKEGIAVIEAGDGESGLHKALSQAPSMIVLDVMMPELSGLELCRELRKTKNIPILFLSSRDSELDRILGLELGGDDYVIKPFSPRELMARVKAMLRRVSLPAQADQSSPESLVCAQLTLNLKNYNAFWQETVITLTATEFNLLHTLMLSPHKVFTRNDLLDGGIFKDIITDRTIDSHIRRLRQKFSAVGCQSLIETVHGFGYKLGSCQ